MEEKKESDKGTVKAVIATITGFLFLAIVSVLVKLEQTASVTIEWIVFIQYSTCLFIITILAAKNKFKDLKTQKIKIHLIRGVTGVLAFTCAVIAMSKIPLVNAVLLNNTAPIFIPIITWLWLKNKIDKEIWWGNCCRLCGNNFYFKTISV